MGDYIPDPTEGAEPTPSHPDESEGAEPGFGDTPDPEAGEGEGGLKASDAPGSSKGEKA